MTYYLDLFSQRRTRRSRNLTGPSLVFGRDSAASRSESNPATVSFAT